VRVRSDTATEVFGRRFGLATEVGEDLSGVEREVVVGATVVEDGSSEIGR